MKAFIYLAIAYVVFPILTLWANFRAYYLFDIRDPEFLMYLITWLPSIYLYYIYITQMIIGQRLPVLDRIWGFPNIVRAHQKVFRSSLVVFFVLHIGVHIYYEGWEPVIFKPDLGVWFGIIAVLGSIAVGLLSMYRWVGSKKNFDYAAMRLLHQLFYPFGIMIWYHVIYSHAMDYNTLGRVLITSYLVFALLCKLQRMILDSRAPHFEVKSIYNLSENFVELEMRAVGKRTRALSKLQEHKGGQYAYFSFLREDGAWEEHPFTFSSFVPAHQNQDPVCFRVVIKKLGDFTMGPTAFQPGQKLRIIGPYGVFTCKEHLQHCDFVAIGVGITPFLSILDEFFHEAAGAAQKLRLHWFVRSTEAEVFKQRFAAYQKALPNLEIQVYVDQNMYEVDFHKLFAPSAEQVAAQQRALYVCGAPPKFLAKMEAYRRHCKMPKKNLLHEQFSL